MIKRILIPLDPSSFSETAVETGCAIAKNNNAELTGLVVLDIPGIEKSVGPIPLGGVYFAEKLEGAKKKEARERIQKLLDKFKAKCDREGIKHREAEFQGSPSDRIIKESIFYDLIVIGLKTYYHFETENKPGDSLEQLLDHSVTSVYGVPEHYVPPDISREKIKVVIAFDGSFPAARALHRFTQLAIPDAMEVTILTSNENKEQAEYCLNQAEAFLKAHSIADIKKEWITGDIIEAMKETYLDLANIVVVGAHSNKSVFDFMVGSLTKYLIKTAKKPVLIGL